MVFLLKFTVWKNKKDGGIDSGPLMSKDKGKERLPDKFDLDWRVKKVENTITSLDAVVQKLCNKVETMENMDDHGQNKL